MEVLVLRRALLHFATTERHFRCPLWRHDSSFCYQTTSGGPRFLFCLLYVNVAGVRPFSVAGSIPRTPTFRTSQVGAFFSIRFVALCVRRDKEGRDLKPIFTALVGRQTSFHRSFMYTTLRIAKTKQNKKTTLFTWLQRVIAASRPTPRSEPFLGSTLKRINRTIKSMSGFFGWNVYLESFRNND